jgi:hypothetical protein
MRGGEKHSGVLARTVVMKLRELAAFFLKRPGRVGVVGRMSPATQRRFIQSGSREHPRHSFDVKGLAFVRRAYKGELALTNAKVIGGSAGDKRDCLKRLDRRTRGGEEIAIAKLRRDRSVRLDGYDGASVARFDYRASPDLDKYWKLFAHQ